MLKNLTIKKASALLKNKQISALELARAYLEVALAKNQKLNACLEIFARSAEKQARKIDDLRVVGESLPDLAGLPIILKDNILLYGQIASAGSKILKNFRAPYSATVIKKLKRQGVIFLGRANMDEFAMGSSTENSAFGVTKNPHDLTRVAGGSSGGSAAAVAADMTVFALGSDTGGSIRQPAAFCGVVGLKPTYGTVSRYGLMAMASSLDQIGPLTKTVADAEMVFQVISGQDRLDSTSIAYEYKPLRNFNLKNIKIGIVPEYFGQGLDAEVAATVKKLIKRLGQAGAEIVEIKMPHFKYSLACYYLIMPSEISSNLARYDGIRFGLSRRRGQGVWDIFAASRQAGFGDEAKRRIVLGTYALSAGYYDAYYLQAQKARRLIAQDFKDAWSKVDIVLGPTTPSTAFKIGENTSDPLQMYLEDIYTVPVNLAGVPALSLPVGRDKKGLPIGAHLVANHFTENKLFALGKEIEKII